MRKLQNEPRVHLPGRAIVISLSQFAYSWALTSLPVERYKASELFAALNGNSTQAWYRAARPDPCSSVFLLDSRQLSFKGYAGAVQVHRPGFLRGHELPRQREACGGQPHLSE